MWGSALGWRAVALAVGLAALWPVPRAGAEDLVKVGVVGPMTGVGAPFGIPARDIIKILIDDLNAKGGVNGHKLELVLKDDRTDPTEAARAATRLVREDNVQVVLSVGTASTTLAFMPIAERARIPVIASLATLSYTSKEHSFFPWAFRVCPLSPVMAAQMFNLAVVKPGRKRIAIFYNEDAHGREEAEFEEKLVKERAGLDLVEFVGAPLTAIDLTAQATRIRNANPDVVLMALSSTAAGAAFVRAAQQVGLSATLTGSVLIAQKAFIDAAGPAGEGVYIAAFSNWDDPLPKQAALGRTMAAAGMAPAGWSEILAASGVMVVAEALRHIDGPATGQQIRDALENIHDFDGTPLTGKLSYSKENHDGYGPDSVILVRIHDGHLQTIR